MLQNIFPALRPSPLKSNSIAIWRGGCEIFSFFHRFQPKEKMAFQATFRSEQPVSPIFSSYIMPYERIKTVCKTQYWIPSKLQFNKWFKINPSVFIWKKGLLFVSMFLCPTTHKPENIWDDKKCLLNIFCEFNSRNHIIVKNSLTEKFYDSILLNRRSGSRPR